MDPQFQARGLPLSPRITENGARGWNPNLASLHLIPITERRTTTELIRLLQVEKEYTHSVEELVPLHLID